MIQRKHTPSDTVEFRARGVRLFNEQRSEYRSDNAAYQAIAPKLGCAPDSLQGRCRQSERDAGARNGPSSEEKARIKELDREVRELRQANEILKKASAYFAQAELDRPYRKWFHSLKITAQTLVSGRSARFCGLHHRPTMQIWRSDEPPGSPQNRARQDVTDSVEIRGVHDESRGRYGAIGYVTPHEAEEMFYATLNPNEKAA
jgi:transposase